MAAARTMNMYQSGANALYAFNLIDFQDMCRICGSPSNNLNSLFDDHGCAYDYSSKINVYLPITVFHCLANKIHAVVCVNVFSLICLFVFFRYKRLIICHKKYVRRVQTLCCHSINCSRCAKAQIHDSWRCSNAIPASINN